MGVSCSQIQHQLKISHGNGITIVLPNYKFYILHYTLHLNGAAGRERPAATQP